MSRGLGKTQCAVLKKVVSWSSGIEVRYLMSWLSWNYKKPSISRAIKSLEEREYITREKTHCVQSDVIGESGEDVIRPTSKGLAHWAALVESENTI